MSEYWQGKRVLVLGMARSGVAVARLLCRYGATPLLNDRKTADQLGDSLLPLKELPCEWHLGERPEELLGSCDVLLISPGVPIDSPVVLAAREAQIPVTGELEGRMRNVKKPSLKRMCRMFWHLKRRLINTYKKLHR